VSEEIVALVRRGIEALNRRDIETVLHMCDPEVELVPAVVGGIEGTTFRGRDGYRRWFEQQSEVYDEVTFEPQDILAVGDQVVALYDTRVRGAGSGVELRSPGAAVFTFRAGRLTRQVGYRSQADALEAVGLPE
jgi:ketosteroid isomerase-like protein